MRYLFGFRVNTDSRETVTYIGWRDSIAGGGYGRPCEAPDDDTARLVPLDRCDTGCGIAQAPEEEHGASGGRDGLTSLLHGAKRAGEEDERVFSGRDVYMNDLSHDDPVIAGGMLGHDRTLE